MKSQSPAEGDGDEAIRTPHDHLVTLARRTSRPLGLGADTLEALANRGTLPGGPPADALDAIASLANRLRAHAIDAVLADDALRVAIETPDDVELPARSTRASSLTEIAFGVPLVLMRGRFVSIAGPSPDEDAVIASARLARCHLARVRAWEHEATEDLDIEAAHQMRVSVRRTRSVLRVLAHEQTGGAIDIVVATVRKVGAAAGAVRDHDVILALLERIEIEPRAREATRSALRARRDVVQARLRKQMSSPDHSAALHHADSILQSLDSGPGGRTALEAAHAQFRRELQRLRRRLRADLTATGAYHDVRRALRRVRDTAEVYDRALAKEDKRWRKRLQPLQSMLGDLNDVDTAISTLGRGPVPFAGVRTALVFERSRILGELAVPLALAAVRLEH